MAYSKNYERLGCLLFSLVFLIPLLAVLFKLEPLSEILFAIYVSCFGVLVVLSCVGWLITRLKQDFVNSIVCGVAFILLWGTLPLTWVMTGSRIQAVVMYCVVMIILSHYFYYVYELAGNKRKTTSEYVNEPADAKRKVPIKRYYAESIALLYFAGVLPTISILIDSSTVTGVLYFASFLSYNIYLYGYKSKMRVLSSHAMDHTDQSETQSIQKADLQAVLSAQKYIAEIIMVSSLITTIPVVVPGISQEGNGVLFVVLYIIVAVFSGLNLASS